MRVLVNKKMRVVLLVGCGEKVRERTGMRNSQELTFNPTVKKGCMIMHFNGMEINVCNAEVCGFVIF